MFFSWSLYDNKDPEDQLKWLIETLVQIEALGEKVHLLAHIPSGHANCVNSWMREFNKILDRLYPVILNLYFTKFQSHRFEDTIVAQFNGHSHHDEFFIYYDLEDRTRANGVSFIPGSTSEWNPYYRIYTVEGTFDGSFYVRDYIFKSVTDILQ
jgi:sphingomyelin phosphodiesterase